MKKDFEALNEAYAQQVASDRIDEAIPAIAGAVARVAPKVMSAVGNAAKSGVQQGVAQGVSNRISGQNQQPQQLNASSNKLKQAESLRDEEGAHSKIKDSMVENYRKMIEDGVMQMVESNCDEKSPLTFKEGYECVRDYADNKLRDLEEFVNPVDVLTPGA